MYTNIDSSHGLIIIQAWLDEYKEELPTDFPTSLFLKILHIIMTHNAFQFDNTFWLQTCGTSTGTSCACAYATIYWGYIKRKLIIPKWKNNLLLLRRFIYDKFGIWVGTPKDFNNFIIDINSYSQLQWKTTGLSTSTNCLDLTSSIQSSGTVNTKTY